MSSTRGNGEAQRQLRERGSERLPGVGDSSVVPLFLIFRPQKHQLSVHPLIWLGAKAPSGPSQLPVPGGPLVIPTAGNHQESWSPGMLGASCPPSGTGEVGKVEHLASGPSLGSAQLAKLMDLSPAIQGPRVRGQQ